MPNTLHVHQQDRSSAIPGVSTSSSVLGSIALNLFLFYLSAPEQVPTFTRSELQNGIQFCVMEKLNAGRFTTYHILPIVWRNYLSRSWRSPRNFVDWLQGSPANESHLFTYLMAYRTSQLTARDMFSDEDSFYQMPDQCNWPGRSLSGVMEHNSWLKAVQLRVPHVRLAHLVTPKDGAWEKLAGRAQCSDELKSK